MSGKVWIWILIGVVLITGAAMLVVTYLMVVLGAGSRGPSDYWSWGREVAVVEILGPIVESDAAVHQLKEYREDPRVAAVVLRIDSPGGGVGASQEIYSEVRRLKHSGKKVVASLGSMAASGGYYIACAADSVISDPGTVTGSIGVIMEFPNSEELLRKVGLGFEVIKSGEHKDAGSPWRSMTPEDRKLLQGVVDDVFSQFVEVVSRERKLPREQVMALADGRIFSGQQALGNGLVDQLGDMEDAIHLAGRMAGIKGEPKVVKERRRRFGFSDLLGQLSFLGRLSPTNPGSAPLLEYRFVP